MADEKKSAFERMKAKYNAAQEPPEVVKAEAAQEVGTGHSNPGSSLEEQPHSNPNTEAAPHHLHEDGDAEELPESRFYEAKGPLEHPQSHSYSHTTAEESLDRHSYRDASGKESLHTQSFGVEEGSGSQGATADERSGSRSSADATADESSESHSYDGTGEKSPQGSSDDDAIQDNEDLPKPPVKRDGINSFAKMKAKYSSPAELLKPSIEAKAESPAPEDSSQGWGQFQVNINFPSEFGFQSGHETDLHTEAPTGFYSASKNLKPASEAAPEPDSEAGHETDDVVDETHSLRTAPFQAAPEQHESDLRDDVEPVSEHESPQDAGGPSEEPEPDDIAHAHVVAHQSPQDAGGHSEEPEPDDIAHAHDVADQSPQDAGGPSGRLHHDFEPVSEQPDSSPAWGAFEPNDALDFRDMRDSAQMAQTQAEIPEVPHYNTFIETHSQTPDPMRPVLDDEPEESILKQPPFINVEEMAPVAPNSVPWTESAKSQLMFDKFEKKEKPREQVSDTPPLNSARWLPSIEGHAQPPVFEHHAPGTASGQNLDKTTDPSAANAAGDWKLVPDAPPDAHGAGKWDFGDTQDQTEADTHGAAKWGFSDTSQQQTAQEFYGSFADGLAAPDPVQYSDEIQLKTAPEVPPVTLKPSAYAPPLMAHAKRQELVEDKTLPQQLQTTITSSDDDSKPHRVVFDPAGIILLNENPPRMLKWIDIRSVNQTAAIILITTEGNHTFTITLADIETQDRWDELKIFLSMHSSINHNLSSFSPNAGELIIPFWPYTNEQASEAKFKPGSADKILLLYLIAFATMCVLMVPGLEQILRGVGNAWGILKVLPLLIIALYSKTFSATRMVCNPYNLTFEAAIAGHRWRKKLLVWRHLKKIYVTPTQTKQNLLDRYICFEDGSGGAYKVKLEKIATTRNWNMLMMAIDSWSNCPLSEDDHRLFDTMNIDQRDPTYTQLWLDALTAPICRERLQPLAEKASFQNGRYVIERKLGSGGQGSAYLANDSSRGKVVLKEYILPIYVDARVRRRAIENFQHEASMLSSLKHPCICRLLDVFVEQDRCFLVLEYIEGMNLRDYVQKNGPVPESKVREWAQWMAEILRYLHLRTPPVVHRDFTPDNLMLLPDGTIKLIDFMVAQTESDTATATVVGKHAYLPPEQFRGAAVPRSDIYSYGCTLHYLLTGVEPEPLTESHPILLNYAVSAEMDTFVAKCTAQNLTDRYIDAQEIVAILENAAQEPATP